MSFKIPFFKETTLAEDAEKQTLRGSIAGCMLTIKNASFEAGVFFYEQILDFFYFIREAREKCKDLVNVNLDLAKIHIGNKKYFDASLRYKFILFLEKNNIDATMGLGYVAILQKKNLKALKYFESAQKLADESGSPISSEISSIIETIKHDS